MHPGDPKGELVCLIQFSALNEAFFNLWIDLKPKTSTERRFMAPFGWNFLFNIAFDRFDFQWGIVVRFFQDSEKNAPESPLKSLNVCFFINFE